MAKRPRYPIALTVAVTVVGFGSVIAAAAMARGTSSRKTLHTQFFVHLQDGAWAEKNLAAVKMGSDHGWTCKVSEIELSESPPRQGEDTRIYKSATVTCQSRGGTKIEMPLSCDIGFENNDGGGVRLYDTNGYDFAVMSAECRTSYW